MFGRPGLAVLEPTDALSSSRNIGDLCPRALIGLRRDWHHIHCVVPRPDRQAFRDQTTSCVPSPSHWIGRSCKHVYCSKGTASLGSACQRWCERFHRLGDLLGCRRAALRAGQYCNTVPPLGFQGVRSHEAALSIVCDRLQSGQRSGLLFALLPTRLPIPWPQSPRGIWTDGPGGACWATGAR